MSHRVPLDAGWQVVPYLALDTALEAARAGAAGTGWFPASVPGSIGADLVHAGDIPDPRHERDSLAGEWAAERSWRYATSVQLPELDREERAMLRFDGVDHDATVFWDGVAIARHEGMFTPFEVDLGARATAGLHRLEVVIGPAPESEPQGGRTSRVRVHKSRMTYGWDFCPRFVHLGIWRPVTLEVARAARIVATSARTTLEPDHSAATLDVEVEVGAWTDDRLAVIAELRAGPMLVATARAAAGVGPSRARLRLDVVAPRQWQPNGFGEPVVHDLRLAVIRETTGEVLDERVVPAGLREVRLEANEGAPAAARPYTFVVNGRRVYATGWNWVPSDLFHGVARPDLEAHLLRLAADAHVVLLRVWGGGLIESEAFYAACDRLGIMVWQELSQSSSLAESEPAADPAFVALMGAEARAIIPLRAHHPSLVLWCGGNELADDAGPLDERSPVLAALRDVVMELDPDRAWLPTSPTGPRFHNRLEDIREDPEGLHDVHGPWEHQGLDAHNVLYDAGTSLLNSEFGVEGMANVRQHEALIDAPNRWPAGRENPVYRHLGEWWNNEPLVQRSFGGRIADLETLRRASQHLQADGLRYAVEANRRREPRQSGSLPWQLNESFPNAWCTAAIDHRGDPKPAYHAVRHAYAPVHVCARFARWAWGGDAFEGEVWAWSGLERLPATRVAAVMRDINGDPLGEALERIVDLEAGRPRVVGAIRALLPAGLAILDLSLAAAGGVVASNRYVVSGADDLAPLLDLPRAEVNVTVEQSPDAWRLELEHMAGPAAPGLSIEDARPSDAAGWAQPADGAFVLLPGERRTLEVRWADAPQEGRRLRLTGWNVERAIE